MHRSLALGRVEVVDQRRVVHDQDAIERSCVPTIPAANAMTTSSAQMGGESVVLERWNKTLYMRDSRSRLPVIVLGGPKTRRYNYEDHYLMAAEKTYQELFELCP